MINRRPLLLSACAVLTLIIVSSAASGASETFVPLDEVELGPATLTFNPWGALPFGDRDSSGPGKGNGKGQQKKKDQQSEEGGSSGGSGGSGSGGDGETQEPYCWTWDQTELDFFDRINGSRSRHERTYVRLDPQLTWVAKRHSRDMAQSQTLFHTPDAKLREWVTNWRILG